MLSNPVAGGEDFNLKDKDVGDVARKLSMVWNMYDFFTLYAEVDDWSFDSAQASESKLPADPTPELTNVLDEWIVSRVHQLTREVDEHMQRYDLSAAVKPILPFIDDASNWYVRRSRKRFWKSDNDVDKNDAYRTLHYVLVQLSIVMAPFTPFLAEELYRKLTGGESVHLLDWPQSGHTNELLMEKMSELRKQITKGLEIRASKGIKVRQPLPQATHQWSKDFGQELLEISKDELNVKTVKFTLTGTEIGGIQLVTDIPPELKREGLAREIIRQVQNARKKAGLNVDDRIELALSTSDTLITQAIKEFKQLIQNETLAVTLGGLSAGSEQYLEHVKLEGSEVTLALRKSGPPAA